MAELRAQPPSLGRGQGTGGQETRTVEELVAFVTAATGDHPGGELDVRMAQGRIAAAYAMPGGGLPAAEAEAADVFAALTANEAAQILDVMLASLSDHLWFDWMDRTLRVADFGGSLEELHDQVGDIQEWLFEEQMAELFTLGGPMFTDLYLWGWAGHVNNVEGDVEEQASLRVLGWLMFRSPTRSLSQMGLRGWSAFCDQWGCDLGQAGAALAATHSSLAEKWLAA